MDQANVVGLGELLAIGIDTYQQDLRAQHAARARKGRRHAKPVWFMEVAGHIKEKLAWHMGGRRVVLGLSAAVLSFGAAGASVAAEAVNEAGYQTERLFGSSEVATATARALDFVGGVNQKTTTHYLSLQHVAPRREGGVVVEIGSTELGQCSGGMHTVAADQSDARSIASMAGIFSSELQSSIDTPVVVTLNESGPVCQPHS